MFLEISQNSQKNTGARASFLIKLQASGLQLYWKRDSSTGVSLWILWDFYDQLFLQNSSGGCFCFLSVSLLLPVRFTLSYLPPPLFYSEVLILFLILYLGALFYKKKRKEKKKIFIENHKKIWEIVVLTDRCIIKKMISRKM